MIIDIHTHPLSVSYDGDRLTPEESAEALLHEMNLIGVSICGLLGNSVSPGKTLQEVQAVNDFTSALIALYPDRFFGMVFVNPALPSHEMEQEIDRCIQLPGFRGIKLELDVNCRDPRLDPIARKAIEHRVPVLQHSWYVNCWSMDQAGRDNQQYRSEPHDVAAFARRFPEMKLVMAHLEGSGVRGILDIAECPNVVIDTSGSQPFSGTLEYAVEVLGSDRILFGSDVSLRSYAGQYGRIIGSRLTQEDREKILFQNAATLFDLSPSLLHANH